MTVVADAGIPAAPSAVPGTSETPTTPAVPTTEEAIKSPLDWAKQFKTLSKREAAFHAKESKMAANLKAYEAFESAKANAQINPIAFLKEAGVTYDQITKFLLDGGETSPTVKYSELEKKLDNFKRDQEAERKQQEETNKSRAVQKYKSDIASFVDSNKNEYELLSMRPDASQTIYETIEAYYKQNGTELTFKEAADMCEKYFDETELQKFLNLKKVQSKLAPVKPEPNVNMEDIRPYLRPTTLSHQMHTAESKTDSASKNLSREELIEQSIRLVQKRN